MTGGGQIVWEMAGAGTGAGLANYKRSLFEFGILNGRKGPQVIRFA